MFIPRGSVVPLLHQRPRRHDSFSFGHGLVDDLLLPRSSVPPVLGSRRGMTYYVPVAVLHRVPMPNNLIWKDRVDEGTGRTGLLLLAPYVIVIDLDLTCRHCYRCRSSSLGRTVVMVVVGLWEETDVAVVVVVVVIIFKARSARAQDGRPGTSSVE